MSEKPILEVKNVTRKFRASEGRFLLANNNISLSFYTGKSLGIVGESGCGKSTLMRMIMSLDKPTEGQVLFDGKDISTLKGEELRLHRRNIQMVFQDPALAFNPKMKVMDIICEPLLNYGLIKPSEREAAAGDLLEMVELPREFAGRFPHNMSGGQRQRVGIARAIALKPRMIMCDEATSALDVSVQKTVIELLVRLQKEQNISIGFICHDMALVSQFTHRTAVMYLGNIVEVIPSEKIHNGSLHPYTKALLGAIFDLNMDFSKKIESIESEAPSPLDVPVGCPFQNRCACCSGKCMKENPVLKELEPGHEVACHLF